MKALPYAKFANLPVGSNLPQGWVQEFLTRQCDGITSHPATAGFPYGAKFWGAPSGDTTGTFSAWWPYEQTAYWLDGAVRAGALANRPDVLGMAAEEIDAAIQYAAPDGFIGPEEFRERDRWPYAVFFRALQALYETTGEARYLEALAAHYRGKPHPMGWNRDVTGVEPMIYLFAETRDPAFLEMALDLYRRFNEQCAGEDTALATLASDKKAGEHGVTFNEIAKLAALLYSATGEAVYRDAVVNAYARVDRDSRLADGLHSCSEHIRGRDALDCHEACDITDHTWALGYLIQATGDARYADTIEQVIFNALPGQVTKDFHALQYLSSANQVVADTHSNHNLFQRGFNWMQYRPDMQVQCCPGNVQRALPNFSVLQWMSAPDGLAAVLYAPSRLTASLGTLEAPVEIVTETAYPFEETVRMRIDTSKAVEFTLWLRLPAWCAAPELSINGQAVHDLKPGAFVPVQRAWQSGDTVELRLPFALRVERWPDNGISLCYGPLTLALPIQARAEVEEGNSTLDQQILTMGDRYVERPYQRLPDFPAWNLSPESPWNYGLCLDERSLERVEVRWESKDGFPFELDQARLRVRVPARRIPGWKMKQAQSVKQQAGRFRDGGFHFGIYTMEGDIRLTPPLPKRIPKRLGREEWIELVPYGCTLLRITVFPALPVEE